ncbi:MAG: FtsX-like permease family protein [Thermodesulfovibrionia bacterium]|nr:FtsX-like permease family protein [Thermodesulfovibrionia bacterium]
MEKHKKILEYTLSSLLRRRYKNLAIITVFSFIVAALYSILFLTHSLKKEALTVLKEAPELIVQKVSGGRHDLIPTDYMKRIQEIYGVGRIIPRYWGYYYDAITDSNYTLMGINGTHVLHSNSKDNENYPSPIPLPQGEGARGRVKDVFSDENIKGLKLLNGRMPSNRKECAIGKGVSDVRFTGIDGEIFLIDSKGKVLTFHVVGVFASESAILTNDLIVINKDDILELFGMPSDRATDIAVEVYNELEIPFVASKIREILPDTRPIMKGEIIRTYETLFNWRSGVIFTMFLGALLAFCILAWDKATGLSAEERQEIGILKAIGWETGDVLELKFWEGIVISFTSILTGMIIAYIHIFFLGASLFAPVLRGWSVLFPPFRLIPYVDLYQVFVVLFLTVIPYVASTIIPSWKAAITDPDTVMRG